MAEQKYKAVPRVRMTLTMAIQNKVLHQLSSAFGIAESWDRPHEITCFPSDFAYFMSLVAKMDSPPTMKQLKVEYLDIRKDVLRTTVQQRSHDWHTKGADAALAEEAELPNGPDDAYKAYFREAEPVKPIDYRADAVNWGDALNTAGWEFQAKCPEKSAMLFNNTKAPLRDAILLYLDEVDKKAANVKP